MALGLTAGAVVVLALGPDRLRRLWLGVVAAGAVAAAGTVLLRPYDAFIDGPANPTAEISEASVAVLIVALALAVVGAVVALVDNAIGDDTARRARLRTLAGTALVALVAVTGVAGLAAISDPVGYTSDRIDEFRSLDTTAKGRSG